MNDALCEVLLQTCISHFLKMERAGSAPSEPKRYGMPPESIVIAFGSSQAEKDWKPLTAIEACFRYSAADGLREVATDTVQDRTESGMYYKEAYAELSYLANGTACLVICFGKRFANCYRYRILQDADGIRLTDEKLDWIS